jgi:para-aminobenzoate synthetase component 1
MNILNSNHKVFPVSDTENFKLKMLNWVNQFNIFSFLDNNVITREDVAISCMAAVGAKRFVTLNHADLFTTLRAFHNQQPGWLFGHINYPQEKRDEAGFPDGFFFEPDTLVILHSAYVSISSSSTLPETIFEEIVNQQSIITAINDLKVSTKSTIKKEQYLNIINQIKSHIQRGDCYELNFCQEFYDQSATIDPLYVYAKLRDISPNPFSAFYRINDNYCLCASPERFLQKKGSRIISQPIKGTAKRYPSDNKADDASLQQLMSSEKERTENIMIVDLVRNDLSKIAKEGSVAVSELCAIYSFPQVFQMISTIVAEVDADTHWTTIVDACFPMGSMTGAPKTKVLELINKFEATPRGLFSGTIGYVTPDGDFDFNVVIRSVFYNQAKQQLSYKAGGGITINSNPENEFEESLLKVSAINALLDGA